MPPAFSVRVPLAGALSLLALASLVSACNRGQPAPAEAAKEPVNAAAKQPANADKEHTYDAPAAQAPGAADTRENALLPVGAPLPQVAGTTPSGERVELASFKGKPLVVYFYPKDDTPGCTVEAQEIRDLWSDIQKTGATVIGVSVDDAASHRAFAEKYALPFLLLPDTDRAITTAFGVGLKSGRARRVTFVFDREGRVAKVFPEVTPKGHGREVVEAIRSVGG